MAIECDAQTDERTKRIRRRRTYMLEFHGWSEREDTARLIDEPHFIKSSKRHKRLRSFRDNVSRLRERRASNTKACTKPKIAGPISTRIEWEPFETETSACRMTLHGRTVQGGGSKPQTDGEIIRERGHQRERTARTRTSTRRCVVAVVVNFGCFIRVARNSPESATHRACHYEAASAIGWTRLMDVVVGRGAR